MGRVQFVELKVGGVPRAVAHHQHRDLVWARATRRADTAASARRPQQVALAPAGLQKEGLIGFHNAALARIAMPGCGAKKALSPQKGRVLVHAAGPCGLAHRQAIDQSLRVGLPSIGLAQMRQGGADQGVAGTPTGAATVTPQASTPALWGQLRRQHQAMRACRQIRKVRFPSSRDGRFMQYPQGGGSLWGLSWPTCASQCSKTCLCVHGDLLDEWPTERLLLQHVIGT